MLQPSSQGNVEPWASLDNTGVKGHSSSLESGYDGLALTTTGLLRCLEVNMCLSIWLD